MHFHVYLYMNISSKTKLYAVLPTERYLKKFLATKTNIEPDYLLSNKDKFGSFVYVCLRNPEYKVELNEKRFNEKIKIIIPLSYEKNGKCELNNEAIHLINNFLKNWFYEDFIRYMTLTSMFNIRMDKSILSFCMNYDIEIDIDIQYETLKKQYYRWRQHHGEPVNKYILELVQES